MKKKIRGIFIKRTGRGVRAAAAVLAGIMLATCFTTACQPTPDKPVVIGKNTDYSNTSSTNSSSNPSPLLETHKSDEFQGGNNIVKINATIVDPDTKIPVAVVNNQSFNQDNVDRVIKYFFTGIKIYPTKYMEPTKQDYQDMIIQDKEELIEWENYNNLTNEEKAKLDWLSTPAESIARLNKEISDYGEAYKTAPDKQNVAESDGKLDSKGMLIVQGISPDNELLSLSVFPKSISFSIKTEPTEVSTKDILTNDLNKNKMKKIDADSIPKDILTKASDTLINIGVPSIKVESAEKSSFVKFGEYYHIIYSQTVNDIPILNITYPTDIDNGDNPDNHKDEKQYAEPIEQPTLYIDISQNGKILAFNWSSKISDISITQDNAAIKSFEDIYNVFKKNIAFRNFSPNGKPVTLEISKISLGLMAARQKNSPKGMIIIPVWDFIGTYNVAEVAGANGSYPKGYEKPEFSFLTINAIDGSTINRNLGY